MKLLDILTFRAATSTVDSSAAAWLVNMFGGRTASGQRVTPDSAMTLSAYYGCIRNIAEDSAKLPLKLLRPEGRGASPVVDHPVYRLLYLEPNPDMSAFSFRALLQHWACGWGNGYAEIVDGNRALWPIHPSRVTVERQDGRSGTGPLVYRVRNDNGTITELSAAQVLHVAGLGGDGVTGYSVLSLGAESIGRGLAVQKFGASFFGNGALPAGVLTHPGKIDAPTRDMMRRQWKERHGGADNANDIAILEGDMKYHRITVPPDEAQFLETSDFSVEDVARWFRMPLHKLQHVKRAQGWSTLDAQNTDYVEDCLMPWLVRWEQEAARKLLSESERAQGLYYKHTVQALMRGDQRTRSAFYSQLFNMGALSPDDIRELEDMNPTGKAEGSNYYVQANVVPIEKAGESSAQAPAPKADPGRQEGARAYWESQRPVLEHAAGGIVAKEQRALSRALDKHAKNARALSAWADEFYAELRADFTRAINPILDAGERAGFIVADEAYPRMDAHAIAYCNAHESNPAEAGTMSAEALAAEWLAILSGEGTG